MSESGSAPGRRPAGWCRGPNAPWFALILIAFALVFWPATIGGRYFIIGDAFTESLPLRTHAWRAITSGQVPGWTTALMSGYPLLSMGQLGIGYPLTWGYLFSNTRGEEFYVLAPYVLAPLFVFAYARSLHLSRAAALLAGFSFGYGGMMTAPITHNGMFSNSFMWLPLTLMFLERSRTQAFIPCLLGAAGAYAMAVLSGVGQGFLLAGLVIAAYGAFLTLVAERGERWLCFQRFRGLATAAGAIGLAAGVGAFQIFETRRAHALSVRRELTYELFSQGSAALSEIVGSMLTPRWTHIADVNASVPFATLAFALAALAFSVRRRPREPRIWFWLGVCIVAWVLMLGARTPIHPLLYHVPVFNLFRVPARHTAEWTFAVSILGAYGWDFVASAVASRPLGSPTLRRALALTFTFAGCVTALWWLVSSAVPAPPTYLFGKSVLAIFLVLGTAATLSLADSRLKTALMMVAISVATLSEPYDQLRHSWFLFTKTQDRLETPSATTKRLLQLDPQRNRVYSYVFPFVDEREDPPRLDGPNRTGGFGLHEAGGYEPLLLSRYSKALGGVDLFTMKPDRVAHAALGDPFNSRSHTLDLLNVSYVVRDLRPEEAAVPDAWNDASPLPDRVVLDLGDPRVRDELEAGWSGDESRGDVTGVWSDGARSRVRLELFPIDGDYELRVLASAFGPTTPLRVRAKLNGVTLGIEKLVDGDQEMTWVVPALSLRSGTNRLDFAYSRTAIPARVLPSSSDGRRLAIFVDFIALTPKQ